MPQLIAEDKILTRTFSSTINFAATPSPYRLIARWWSQSESNRRHPACKAGALPTELWPLDSNPQSTLFGGPDWI